ncbi:MAG: hypothetical protein GYA51_03010 [Candidatus Methanofastidiosa archaeon]|nr:hypothetical protein [Candidatus Methanofastidiosa archaeon]
MERINNKDFFSLRRKRSMESDDDLLVFIYLEDMKYIEEYLQRNKRRYGFPSYLRYYYELYRSEFLATEHNTENEIKEPSKALIKYTLVGTSCGIRLLKNDSKRKNVSVSYIIRWLIRKIISEINKEEGSFKC